MARSSGEVQPGGTASTPSLAPSRAPARPARPAADGPPAAAAAQAPLQQRLVVGQPERGLGIGQRLAGPGTRVDRAIGDRNASHRREKRLRHRVVPSERLDHVGHEVALALEEARDRHVHSYGRPGHDRIRVRQRRGVVRRAHQRRGASIRGQSDGHGAHQRIAALPAAWDGGESWRARWASAAPVSRSMPAGPGLRIAVQRCASALRSRRPAASSSARMQGQREAAVAPAARASDRARRPAR